MLLHPAPALSRVVWILLAPVDRVLTAPAVKEGVTPVVPQFAAHVSAHSCSTLHNPSAARWSGLLEGCGKWHNAGWGFVGKGPTDLQELCRLRTKCCISLVFQVNEENI